MASGNKMLVLSSDTLWQQRHPEITALGCNGVVVSNREEARTLLATGDFEVLVVVGKHAGRALLDGPSQPAQESLAEIERRHIFQVLSATNGNKAAAARILGIDTKTLYNRLKSYERSGVAAQGRSGDLQESARREHSARG